ncbi:hypothetical protein IWZ01DRAFT_344446 [Phyllosticta capitalensis]
MAGRRAPRISTRTAVVAFETVGFWFWLVRCWLLQLAICCVWDSRRDETRRDETRRDETRRDSRGGCMMWCGWATDDAGNRSKTKVGRYVQLRLEYDDDG